MDIRRISTALLVLILGLAPLPAQEEEPLAAPAVQEPALEQGDTPQAQGHPFVDTGFYPSWSKMTAEAAQADAQYAIDLAKQRLAAIRDIPEGQETWENVFLALDKSYREVDIVFGYLINLFQVRRTYEMQQVQEALTARLSSFYLEITNDERLWQVVKRASTRPWVQELGPEEQYYVQRIVADFQDSGADLPADKKAYLQKALAELIKLHLQFDRNAESSAYLWEMEIKDPRQLEGMPAAWLKESASGQLWNRHWTLSVSDIDFVLSHCSVEATRKACWEGWNTLGKAGEYDNEPVVARIMELRQEVAEALGFAHFADMACKSRMVDTGDKALAFVDDMMDRLLPAFRAEQQELLDIASELTGRKVEKLNPWDYKFYETQLAKRHSDFDEESLRPYLRSDNVLKGMFAAASKLYDISFTELPAAFIGDAEPLPDGAVEVWADGVKVFKVTDNKTGRHLGSFYYDPFCRFAKQGGAWTQAMRPGMDGEPHLIGIICNFSAPGPGGYTLLTKREVETLFHEFGHALHALFCESSLSYFSMSNIKPDFAELPSQFNESYTWEPEVMAGFAFHHETGEPMPADLAKQLRGHHAFHPATAAMSRLTGAKLDLEMHMHFAEKFGGKPLDDATAEILAPWSAPLTGHGSSEIRVFAHSVSKGYAAAYFSYPWTEALAADVFARFKEEGLFNPALAESFRRQLLRPAASRPSADLYRDFMGRDPQPDALLEKYGIKKADGGSIAPATE